MTITFDRAIRIEDIASLHEPPSGQLEPGDATRRLVIGNYTLGRRDVLRVIVAMGTAAGFSVLGFFPKAANASHNCKGWLENYISGGCYIGYSDCMGCGPSLPYGPACSGGYHKYTGDYRNRPDECNLIAEADGWRWTSFGCGCSSECARNYRCHDGCSKIEGAWKHTICRVISPGCLCP